MEQPLASPGSAKKLPEDVFAEILVLSLHLFNRVSESNNKTHTKNVLSNMEC